MFYNVMKAKEIVELDGKALERKLLMGDDEHSLSIIAMRKEEIIDTHTSKSDAAVYVLDGEIEIHFEAEKFKIEKGELLMFNKDKEHKVLALKNSKYLLIKI